MRSSCLPRAEAVGQQPQKAAQVTGDNTGLPFEPEEDDGLIGQRLT
ncbi:hypothetical protein [Streptomyces mirabilis]